MLRDSEKIEVCQRSVWWTLSPRLEFLHAIQYLVSTPHIIQITNWKLKNRRFAAGPGTGRHGSRPTLWWLQAPPPPPVPSSGPPRRHRGLRCPHLSTKNHGLKQYLKETDLTLEQGKHVLFSFEVLLQIENKEKYWNIPIIWMISSKIPFQL